MCQWKKGMRVTSKPTIRSLSVFGIQEHLNGFRNPTAHTLDAALVGFPSQNGLSVNPSPFSGFNLSIFPPKNLVSIGPNQLLRFQSHVSPSNVSPSPTATQRFPSRPKASQLIVCVVPSCGIQSSPYQSSTFGSLQSPINTTSLPGSTRSVEGSKVKRERMLCFRPEKSALFQSWT